MRGGAVPFGLFWLVPASAPGSEAERERARSSGSGAGDFRFSPEPRAGAGSRSAGGRQGFGAGGRPSLPGTSRSSAPGTCRASQAETLSEGGRGEPAWSSPSRGSHPRGLRRQSRPPLTALESEGRRPAAPVV